METIIIRRIKKEDREIYLSLTEKFYLTDGVMAPIREEYRERCFDEMMERDTYADCFLACVKEKAVGYVLLAKTFSQEGGGLTVWVEELYVLPEARGKGVASKLLSFVLENFPVPRYRLEVEPENGQAVRLYEKFGFSFIPYQEMVKVRGD